MDKRVIVIDETDTSKTCSLCGHKKNMMSLFKRIYHCEICGAIFNRDKNSAGYILTRFFSQHALWTSYQHFFKLLGSGGNLRHTAQGETKVSHYCCPPFKTALMGSADS